jgi:hypothetical protein
MPPVWVWVMLGVCGITITAEVVLLFDVMPVEALNSVDMPGYVVSGPLQTGLDAGQLMCILTLAQAGVTASVFGSCLAVIHVAISTLQSILSTCSTVYNGFTALRQMVKAGMEALGPADMATGGIIALCDVVFGLCVLAVVDYGVKLLRWLYHLIGSTWTALCAAGRLICRVWNAGRRWCVDERNRGAETEEETAEPREE